MIYNSNNTKYKSVLAGLTFGARQIGNAAVEIRGGVGRRMEAHNFSLYPVLRDPPDLDCLGRAILEFAMRESEQPPVVEGDNLWKE